MLWAYPYWEGCVPEGSFRDRRRLVEKAGFLALLLSGCAAQQGLAPVYPSRSNAELARSVRCRDGRCRCRPLDADVVQRELAIPASHKRFELRLPRSTSAIWVEVEGRGVYYKPAETVDPTCFYLDLYTGRHYRVTVHAESRDEQVGLQTGLTIFEYGEKAGPSWYQSFRMTCGYAASRCTRGDIDSWKQFQQALPRGLLDPCGSVRVRSVRISGRRSERLDRNYQDLTVQFELHVYEFEPYRRPGAPECSRSVERRSREASTSRRTKGAALSKR